MCGEGRTVVCAEFCVPEAAGPGADGVGCRGEEFEAECFARDCLQARGGVGPGDGDDEEERFAGSLDAELSAGADEGWAEVEHTTRLRLGEPACTIISTDAFKAVKRGAYVDRQSASA